uniref:Ankyrin repeat domain-containing protein 54 n=1 Tax=Daphnia galeata TaxID=27404 RepID=A0A8J2RQD3_9CRUS|nr:unnamed protein product [Daphnia galeata]
MGGPRFVVDCRPLLWKWMMDDIVPNDVLNSISSRITSEEQKKLEKFFYDDFRDPEPPVTTLLHDAVFYGNWAPRNHTHIQTIKRILQFGADPNAIDEYGQTPLHRLAEWTQFTDMDESVPFFQVLLDAGAHLDTVAEDGKTVVSILKEKLEGKVHPYFESLIDCDVFPLSCFCARVIGRHGIPFEDRLPPRLKKLVSIHSPKASIDLHQLRHKNSGDVSLYSTVSHRLRRRILMTQLVIGKDCFLIAPNNSDVTHTVFVDEKIAYAVIEANSPALFTGHSNVSNVSAVIKVTVGPPFDAAVARLEFSVSFSVDQHRRNNNNQQQ